jgi:hypothetical protein
MSFSFGISDCNIDKTDRYSSGKKIINDEQIAAIPAGRD